jgi:hypothetical protein
MAVAGPSVYLTGCRDRLRIVDVRNPAKPVEAGSFPLSFLAGPIAVANGRAFVADEVGLFKVLDVTNPAAVHELGRYSFESFPEQAANQLAVLGNDLFAQYDDSLVVIDVSDPAAMQEVSRRYSYGHLLITHSEHLYVDDLGLTIYGLSNAGELVPEAGYGPGALGEVRVDDHTAYVASGAGLHLLDITNPAAPLDLGFYASPYIGALAVADSPTEGQPRYLYTSADVITAQNSGNYLQALNISDLTQPATLVYQGAGQTVGTVIRGKRLFSLLDSGTVVVFDLTDPARPVRLGDYQLPGQGVALDASGEFVYASNGERLFMLQLLPYHIFAPLVVQ